MGRARLERSRARLRGGLAPAAAAWTPADWGTDRLNHYVMSAVTTSGANITAFTDQASGGNNATAGSAATLDAAYAGFNGKPAAHFETVDYYTHATPAGSYTSFSVCAVIDMITVNTSTSAEILWASVAGGGAMAELELYNNQNVMGFRDTGHRSLGVSAITGPQTLIWSFDAATTTCTLYRNGVSVGSAAYIPTNIGGSANAVIGALQAAAWEIENSWLAELVILGRASAAEDVANFHSHGVTEYDV